MGVLFDLARTLRRFLRVVCAVATLLTIAAPAAFGPAVGPVIDRLGSLHEHVCKCGMAPGKCGCPECERAEQQRLQGRGRHVAPALEDGCDHGNAAVQLSALPPVSLPAGRTLLPIPRGERLLRGPAGHPALESDVDPPTPPPRLASV